MRLVIIGGGSLGYYVARQASAHGDAVTMIVDTSAEAERLARRLGVVAVVGEASDLALLEECEVGRADAVVALGPEDHDNLIVCQVARRFFAVAHTVAVVNDPDNRPLFERLGVAAAVSAAELLGSVIEQESTFEGVHARLALARGAVSLTELRLDDDSPAVARPLSALDLPEQALISAVIRRGAVYVPRGRLVLEAGDELVLVSARACLDDALQVLVGGAQ